MKTRTRKHMRLCLLISLFIFTAFAFAPFSFISMISNAAEKDTEEKEEEGLLAPYFIIQSTDPDAFPIDCFPLKSTDVVTNINGMIAETYVTQTYTNEGTVPINARYVFPTSPSVTVHGMKMEIGNHIVTAQIKEKEEAKKEFEEAKSEGKSASLLEQKRPNVFTMDVANIMPGDTARIELHYTELITAVEGTYEFIFPTVVGPRYAASSTSEEEHSDSAEGNSNSDNSAEDNDWVASPYLADGVTPPGEYHITVNLSTGVPIADLSCKSHQISVIRDGEDKAQVTLSDENDYAGNRDFILKYKLTGEEVQSGLVLTQGEKENYFMLTVQPPERYTPEEIPPQEYIFVLDVSGSMYGYPLETAKTLIRDMVEGLRETDQFNLILFANSTIQLSQKSLPATAQNIQAATDLVDEQKGGGGTSLLPALKEAVSSSGESGTARSIVIITDGYVDNETTIFDFIDENMDTASFFSFGIGSSVNRYLIDGIAGAGLGESFLVTDSEDAAESAERFRNYIGAPLLTDISIDYKDFDVYDVELSTPSTLFAQRPIVLFGKWRGTPSGTITVSGKSGTQDYREEISVAETAVDSQNEAIRYLWARTRLDRVAGYGSVRNDSSVKEEITRIGLEYNLTTPYTSFVAVVDTIRNTDGESTDVNQALPLPLQVSNLAVGGGYTAYSEPECLLFLLITMGAAIVLMSRKRLRKAAQNRYNSRFHRS